MPLLASYLEDNLNFGFALLDTTTTLHPYRHTALQGMYWLLASAVLASNRRLIEQNYLRVNNVIGLCYRDCGGFAANPQCTIPDIFSTMAAVQTVELLSLKYTFDRRRTITWILSLQDTEKSFLFRLTSIMSYQPPDLRFTLSALATLHHLGYEMEEEKKAKLASAILKCWNGTIDGGFGATEGDESHAGFVFCALASLSLLNKPLPRNMIDSIYGYLNRCWNGSGLRGRLGKEPDVCYAWWVTASMFLLARLTGSVGNNNQWTFTTSEVVDWIDTCKATGGGYSRNKTHQSTQPDPFHTFFALATIALIDDQIDARTALPRVFSMP